jgi:hypothetical protein
LKKWDKHCEGIWKFGRAGGVGWLEIRTAISVMNPKNPMPLMGKGKRFGREGSETIEKVSLDVSN